MTIQQIIDWFGNHPKLISNYFIGIIILPVVHLEKVVQTVN